uniref:ATP synthase subunit a n=1 Tax=Paracatonidia sp. SX-2018 TaxID=2507540 RepID=A0A510CQY8_9HEMI|nr:ATP synthase F0 subunit 6 [Paracatonidia sp. SX-2018]
MMTSLFSTFDPSSFKMQMNWIMMTSTLMIMPLNFWMSKSRWIKTKKIIENKIISEFKSITTHKEILIMTKSMFVMILVINIMGLFPYTFTPTSHISLTLSMALPMWMMMMIYGWTKFTNNMFMHMLPMGTPYPIMPMMIIIETTGNIIRPISLSVRLMANMLAGHLLMTLLGNLNELNMMILTFPIKMMLMSFETAISIIQAYVFSTLITLYSSEIP